MKLVALTTAFACASLVVAEQDAIFGGIQLESGARNLSSAIPRVNFRRALKGGKKKKSSSSGTTEEPIEEPEEEVQPEPEVVEPEVFEPEVVEPEVVEPEVVEPEQEEMLPSCEEVNQTLVQLIEELDASNASSRSTISLFFQGYLRYLGESGATITDEELYDVLRIESALDPSFVSVEVGIPMPEVREECELICDENLDRIGELQDSEQDNVDIVMYFLGRNYVVQQDA